MLEEDMRARNLPPTVPQETHAENWADWRQKTLDLFMREEYGLTPPAPESVRAEKGPVNEDAWAGKAQAYPVTLRWQTPGGEFSFPMQMVVPKAHRPVPLFVYLSFSPYGALGYCPVEEIVDHGYALATFCYNDVTRDEEDHDSSGLAPLYPRTNPATDWGKIGMWAFAASRVLDYALQLPYIDSRRVYVVGHSRLGKAALWAGAQDERFAGVVSNDSGCSGAAVTRGKRGEKVKEITRFTHWFCRNYHQYAEREAEMPFDQHQLLALIAPRLLYVASASEDAWADPASEFMGAALASQAYERLGLQGLVNPAGDMIQADQQLHEGRIGCHLRPGPHFLSRYDWQRFMAYFDRHAPGAR